MKTTLDIDDQLYRRLKAHAALNGLSVKTVITDAIQQVLARSSEAEQSSGVMREPPPKFVSSLSAHAESANGNHDVGSIRERVMKKQIK